MRLIDADRLHSAIDTTCRCMNGKPISYSIMHAMVENADTVDPVKHGHWIHTGVTNVYGGHQHKCSVCGYTLMVSPMCDGHENYCCECGAKMAKEVEE